MSKKISIEVFSNNFNLIAEVNVDKYVDEFKNKVFEGLNVSYDNFKKDKETRKKLKVDDQEILNNIVPRTGFKQTFDVRSTGDSNLIKTYEAIDSPNATDTGMFGGMQNNPLVNDEPVTQTSYQYSNAQNKERKRNFEKDKDSTKTQSELPKRIKKILFRG